MNRSWLLILIPGAFLTAVQAQPATDAPPAPPFVKEIPDNSQWVITVTSTLPPAPAGGDAASPVVLKSETITVTDDVRRDAFVWSNGTKSETWIYHGVTITQDARTRQIYLTNDRHVSLTEHPPAPRSWDQFDWLSAETYAKHTTEGGATCYEFDRPADGARALVAVESRWPVLCQEGPFTYHYEKGDAPSEKLTLPPGFSDAWNQYVAALKKLTVNRPAR